MSSSLSPVLLYGPGQIRPSNKPLRPGRQHPSPLGGRLVPLVFLLPCPHPATSFSSGHHRRKCSTGFFWPDLGPLIWILDLPWSHSAAAAVLGRWLLLPLNAVADFLTRCLPFPPPSVKAPAERRACCKRRKNHSAEDGWHVAFCYPHDGAVSPRVLARDGELRKAVFRRAFPDDLFNCAARV